MCIGTVMPGKKGVVDVREMVEESKGSMEYAGTRTVLDETCYCWRRVNFFVQLDRYNIRRCGFAFLVSSSVEPTTSVTLFLSPIYHRFTAGFNVGPCCSRRFRCFAYDMDFS